MQAKVLSEIMDFRQQKDGSYKLWDLSWIEIQIDEEILHGMIQSRNRGKIYAILEKISKL